VKVNKISLKQMGGQAQNQTVDPAIQQITTHISNSINEGEDPIAVLAGLIEQQVDQNIIGQAFMVAGYQEEDVIALFEEFQKQSQPPGPASEQEQTRDPQEIARNQAMEKAAIEEEAQQEQQLMAQQEAMSQQLQAKSGIEIKPENEGKFTAWAKARGLSVPDAYNKVMNNTKGYSPSVVKMANFAKNAAKWKKEKGGETAYLANRDRVIKKEMAKAQSKSMKEGGEFKPHFMYKGERKIRAKDLATHLRLKEAGYTHENKAQAGKETTADEDFYNKTGIVKRKDKLTIAPNYVNPIAFESNDNFNIGQVGATLKGGFDTMLSGKDKNEDGVKDGSFRDWKRKGAIQKGKKGDYYNYEVKVDPNDPNKYGYDNLDLYNASKTFNKGGLRDLQTFTNDVNQNSRVNFNPETGEYDALISSRKLNNDIYGAKTNRKGKVTREANNALAGENLNYFNNVDADTRELILGTQDYQDGVTLGINPEGNAASYINKEDNPYYYDTMMGRNKVGVNTTMNETQNSMIPTNSNGQPQQGMFASSGPRVENNDFNTLYKKNMSSNLGKSKAEMEQLYNSTINNEFKYGGNLPKAQTGLATPPDSLNLYYAALAKNAFYKDNPDYSKIAAYTTNADIPNLIETHKEMADWYNKEAKSENEAYLSNMSEGRLINGEPPVGSIDPRFTRQGNLYSFGDILHGYPDWIYNTESPPIYLHPNIKPQGWERYKSTYDSTDIPNYEPSLIWPKSLGPEGSVREDYFDKSSRTTPDPKRSVSDNLTSMGMDNSFPARKKLYLEEAGLGDTYGGTPEENIKLNEWLTQGGLDQQKDPVVTDTPIETVEEDKPTSEIKKVSVENNSEEDIIGYIRETFYDTDINATRTELRPLKKGEAIPTNGTFVPIALDSTPQRQTGGSTGTSVDDPDHKGIGTADGNHERYTPTAEELLLLSKYENESINPPIEIVETPMPITNDSGTKQLNAYLNPQDPQEYSLFQAPEYETIQMPDGTWQTVDVKKTPPLALPVGGVEYKGGGSTSTSFSKWIKNNNLPKAQEGISTVTPSLDDPKYPQMLKSFGVTVDYDPIDSTYRVKDYGDPEKIYMGFPELPTYKQLEEARLLDLLPSWWDIEMQPDYPTDPYKSGGSTNNSFSKWVKNNNLPKAQFNLPENIFGNLYNDAQQEGMGDYFTDMTKTDYIKDTQAVADAQLQNEQAGMGITPQQEEIENLFTPQGAQTLNVTPTYDEPTVKRTDKFQGAIDRAMDNRGVKAVGDASEFAVNVATVANNWFEDKAINDARVDNRNKLVADNIYGTNEDPFMKRGAWDINTGTFGSEGQRTVETNMGIAQRGAEISSKTIDVDSTLLAKLIAAGADIEIL
jgi:hypothetical protein